MSLGLSCYDSSSESDTEAVKDLPPKKKQKVKILVPEHKNSSSDEDESSKKGVTQTTSSGSSLFSKLPPPRNAIGGGKQSNRPLLPYVFSKRKQTSVKTPVLPAKTSTNDAFSDESDASDSETSFFSYVSKAEVVASTQKETNIAVPEVHAECHKQDANILQDSTLTPSEQNPAILGEHSAAHGVPPNFDQNQEKTWMKDEQFLRIQGKKNRNEKIDFIDINADSALEGNKELLLKSISEEKNINRSSHSKKKNKDMPSSQHKRKHQLSYLIHQAREREIELKNAWASGHAARQAARNRYGF